MLDVIRELKAHFGQHKKAREFVVLRDPSEIYERNASTDSSDGSDDRAAAPRANKQGGAET